MNFKQYVKRTASILSAGCILASAVFSAGAALYTAPEIKAQLSSSIGNDEYNGLVSLINNGLNGGASVIDIYSNGYRISKDDSDLLFYIARLDSRPDITGHGYTVVSGTDYIYQLRFERWNGAELPASAASMLDGIAGNAALSDVQKALLLHDRIAAFASYDSSRTNEDAATASGLFNGGTAVCSGYTEAYELLLSQCGIDASTVSSDSLNHVWNLVGINGKRFHVDVTWDDPVYSSGFDIPGMVVHNNFLRSTDGIVLTGHNASDFNTEPAADDYEDFDAAVWQSSISQFVLLNGRIFYMNNYVGKNNVFKPYIEASLMEWTPSGPVAIRPKVSWKSAFVATVNTSETDFNMYTFNMLTTDGEYLYYTNGKSIFRLDPDSTSSPETVYTLEGSPMDSTAIFGLNYENGALVWKTGTNANQAASSAPQYLCCGYHDYVSNICSRCGDNRRLSQFTSISVSHSCTVENDLSLNYYFTLGSNGADFSKFTNVRLEVTKTDYDSSGKAIQTTTVLTPKTDTSKGYNRFKFTFAKISASEVGNSISAVLHAEYEGRDYCSGTDTYNIRKYAYTMLEQASSGSALKKLLVDLLNYSAASQQWFGYNTAALVNADLTAAQKLLGSQGIVDLSGLTLPAGNVLQDATASFNSRAVVLGSNIELKYYMILPDGVNLDNISLQLTYTSLIDGYRSIVISGRQFLRDGSRYTAKLSTVRACDLGQPVTAVITMNGTPISSSMVYNAEMYAKNMLIECDNHPENAMYSELKVLLDAMVKYSRSAKEYFESK